MWSDLVKSVAEAARANHLGEAELRESAGSLGRSSSSRRCPNDGRTDGRQTWRDCLASDIDAAP